MSQVQVKLEKLEEAEEKAKTTIQAIQQEIDESAKVMVAQNAEHQKQKKELEIRKKLALKSLEERYQIENTELEAKNWERNAKFAKEMANLKERLKDKVDWKYVDLALGKNLVSPIANPNKNGWNKNQTKNSISISVDGLNATNNATGWRSVSANKGFLLVDISGPVIYYFEVTITMMSSSSSIIHVGLSSGNIPNRSILGVLTNSYAIAIRNGYGYCLLSGIENAFEWPNGAIKPIWNGPGDVIGCGLLLNAEKEVSIFFTGNGLLMGKQYRIDTTMNTIYPYPTVSMEGSASVEANFGGDPAKPFKYDTNKCPELVFK